MNFPVKKNIWFTVMIWGFLSFIILIYIFGGEPIGYQLITYKSIPGYTIAILMVTLLLWLWFGTSYQIEGEKLKIKLGPYRKSIKINDIKKISSKGGSLSTGTLMIHYGKYDVISLSPKDKSEFLDFLLASNPNIQLESIDN